MVPISFFEKLNKPEAIHETNLILRAAPGLAKFN